MFFFVPASNALGAYGGPYSVYRGLAVAMEELAEDVRTGRRVVGREKWWGGL